MTEVINASHLVKFYPDLLIEYSLSYSLGALVALQNHRIFIHVPAEVLTSALALTMELILEHKEYKNSLGAKPPRCQAAEMPRCRDAELLSCRVAERLRCQVT